MAINATAGAKVFIGPATTTADTLAEFQAITTGWAEITPVEDLGEWGAEATELTFKALGDRHTRRMKGSFDAGTIELIVGRDPLDAGQIAAKAAFEDHLPYAFRVVLEDAPAGGTGTTFYFRAVVLSVRNNFGTEDNVTRTTLRLGIDGAVFEVPAAEAVDP
ncbi:hypothetical protein [Pseudogemmobacter sonorensis]|uniref:hypothetical protein n=1 Tax=Pseudogemmobacter sonorensis TaxID=2989681 RepID=UPI00367FA03E